MKRKSIALFIVALLVITMITGCVAKKEDDKSVEQETPATTHDKVDGESRETVAAKDGTIFYKTGLPIVDKPVSFTIWAATSAEDPSKFPVCKIYEEQTGISPKWITVPSEGLAERKSIMWASGDYPDVLGPSIVKNLDIDTYGPMGIIIPLNDYIDNHLVELKKLTTADEWNMIWSKLKYPDGNIYTYPTITEYFHSTEGSPIINKKWLEELGLEMPTTPDDFVEVLRAFKTKDPNGNNKADEIPLTCEPPMALPRLLDIASWTGVIGHCQYIEDGKLIWPLKSDELKESIAWLHSLWMERLIDVEIFTQDKDTFFAKGQNPSDTLFGVSYSWREGNTFGEDRSLDYFPMEPLKGQSGKQLSMGSKDLIQVLNQLSITSACQVPEIVTRWVDFMYDPMISLQTDRGAFGEGVYEEIDGKYKPTIPEGHATLGAYFVDHHLQQLPRFLLNARELLYSTPGDYIPFKYAKGSEEQKLLHDDIRGPYVIDMMPGVKPTAEEIEILNLYTPDFDKYYKESLTRFITGQTDLESNWETYCLELDRLGYEKILKVRQEQLDRFNSK